MPDVERKRALTESEIVEIEAEMQRILEEDPEAFRDVFGGEQPFDSNMRFWNILELKGGGWGVELSVGGGPSGRVRTAWPFNTKEDALAFIAEHAPKND